MIFRGAFVIAITVAVTTALNGQAPSFSGTWTLNLRKSQLTGQTMTITRTPSGVLHFDNQGFGYDFDLTGKEFPMPDGGTTSWRVVDANTWVVTNSLRGQAPVTYRLTLKGTDTLTTVATVMSFESHPVEQLTTHRRLSGGPGFFGKWQSTEVQAAPSAMQITLEGERGITVAFADGESVCKANFDGKDYPFLVAGAALKQTAAFKKLSTHSFKMVTKLSGKTTYVDIMTLSADGKMVTDEGRAISVKERMKAVYDRQETPTHQTPRSAEVRF